MKNIQEFLINESKNNFVFIGDVNEISDPNNAIKVYLDPDTEYFQITKEDIHAFTLDSFESDSFKSNYNDWADNEDTYDEFIKNVKNLKKGQSFMESDYIIVKIK